MITSNVIGNVITANRVGELRKAGDEAYVVEDALLLENGKPLLMEGGKHFQLESTNLKSEKE